MSDLINLEKVLEESFRELFNRDDAARVLYGKIRQKTATYSDAQRFAQRVGKLLSEAFRQNTTEDMFPAIDNKQAIAEAVLKLLKVDHEIVSEAAAAVQKTINTNADIGLNAVVPKMDYDRASGIAQNVVDQNEYSKAVDRFESATENYSQHIVDESVRQNARFQWKNGMSPKIVRTASWNACKWCKNLAGTYDYSEVRDTGNDVFRRHERCNCRVEYIADRGRATDVWSKSSYRYGEEKERQQSIRSVAEARNRRLEVQKEARITRAKGIERVQRELGYSPKGASIWYNQHKKDIDKYGVDYAIKASKGYEDSRLTTGARIVNPNSKRAEKFAEEYYESVRHMSTDHIRISNNTGYSSDEILKIKKYLFIDESYFDEDTGKWERFQSDCRIAQSWQRLSIGQDIKPHDYTLLQHELLEMKIKEENPGIDHYKAHLMASKVYNYSEESDKYYGDLEKHSKK